MDNRATIRQFVRGLLEASGDADELHDSDSLLLSGRLQSIDAVEIVIFLEEKFAVDFTSMGFDRDRLDSVDAIVGLIS